MAIDTTVNQTKNNSERKLKVLFMSPDRASETAQKDLIMFSMSLYTWGFDAMICSHTPGVD